MPTISVNRDAFLEALGGHWCELSMSRVCLSCSELTVLLCKLLFAAIATEDAEVLFFDYGLELDEDVSILCEYSRY
jgi:hypothetical protein